MQTERSLSDSGFFGVVSSWNGDGVAEPLPHVKAGAASAYDSHLPALRCTENRSVQPIAGLDHWCPGLPMLLALFKTRQVDHAPSGASRPMIYTISDLALDFVSEVRANRMLTCVIGDEKATLGNI